MNFFENERILPTFFQELPVLLQHLGPQKVYISIFENGSSDTTPILLNLMAELLDSIGTPHRIITLGTSDIPNKEEGYRIAFLARARNKALEPLYNGAAAREMRSRAFDEVMFMNDVAHCAVDMVEMIYQKRKQGAHQACAVDWGGWGGQVVYDRWVLRTMSGRPFYRWEDMVYYVRAPDPEDGKEKPFSQPLLYDDEDRARFLANLPLQVFSCWNGATVFNAAAFFPPHNIRFRTARNDPDESGSPRSATDKASESYLMSVDLWKAKMGKILLVPRASVSYWPWDYYAYRKDAPLSDTFNDADEMVEWKLEPPPLVAMQDFARWEEVERWGAWDEP
ncbi:glycosyltransferase family 69 protein [Hydnum rufescens UP504]|uniref:Glycosyltransferase family 69 protein n=1 Tax=Hydnum rufescens UP504 TaxID=1448309 RepID=A0A9P6DU06_9AGAM|nr:glycosyltransferase family 69 protein [Hydnum rufescens UP504]